MRSYWIFYTRTLAESSAVPAASLRSCWKRRINSLACGEIYWLFFIRFLISASSLIYLSSACFLLKGLRSFFCAANSISLSVYSSMLIKSSLPSFRFMFDIRRYFLSSVAYFLKAYTRVTRTFFISIAFNIVACSRASAARCFSPPKFSDSWSESDFSSESLKLSLMGLSDEFYYSHSSPNLTVMRWLLILSSAPTWLSRFFV